MRVVLFLLAIVAVLCAAIVDAAACQPRYFFAANDATADGRFRAAALKTWAEREDKVVFSASAFLFDDGKGTSVGTVEHAVAGRDLCQFAHIPGSRTVFSFDGRPFNLYGRSDDRFAQYEVEKSSAEFIKRSAKVVPLRLDLRPLWIGEIVMVPNHRSGRADLFRVVDRIAGQYLTEGVNGAVACHGQSGSPVLSYTSKGVVGVLSKRSGSRKELCGALMIFSPPR